MAKSHRRRRAPFHFLIRSALFLLALAVLVAVLREHLLAGFMANPPLNGTIVAVLLFGIGFSVVALVRSLAEARAIDRAEALLTSSRRNSQSVQEINFLIFNNMPADLAEFLETVHRVTRQGSLTATLPYLLDSLATRTEDRRALVRFLTGALILLGLIGTFYGLLITIGGVRDVLGGLSAAPGDDIAAMLTGLRERLSVPLGGMGLAFSSSLYGLSASLALAFLELQLFHAQSDVHARVESLVVSTLLPYWGVREAPAEGAAGGGAAPGYLGALLETAAEHMEQLAGQLARRASEESDTDRIAGATELLAERIATLNTTLTRLEADRTETLRNELRLLTRTLARGESAHAPEA